MALDAKLFQWLFGWANRNFFLDSLGIFLAKYLVYLLVAGILVFIYLERDRRRRWFVFTALVMAVILSRGILTEVIRYFLPARRPFEILDITPLFSESLNNSFPSGHAAFLFALGMTLWFFNRRWGIWYLVLAAAVGAGRVFAGVHWPRDILGGAAVGIFSAGVIYLLLRRYLPFRKLAAESKIPENL
jgi:undecaprenyl-diphosphatase